MRLGRERSLPAETVAEGVQRLGWLALAYVIANITGPTARLVLAAAPGTVDRSDFGLARTARCSCEFVPDSGGMRVARRLSASRAEYAEKDSRDLARVRIHMVPPALDALIMECLAKDADHRPASAAVVSERLAAAVPADVWTVDAAGAWWERYQPLTRPPAIDVAEEKRTSGNVVRLRPRPA